MELIEQTRIIRIQTVKNLSGMSRSGVYRAMSEAEFPAPVRLGPRSVGWRESEVAAWLAARPRTRPQPTIAGGER